MKVILTVVTCLGAILSAAALQADTIDECELWRSKASQYMNWRQEEFPISKAVKETTGNRSTGLLLRAYNQPVMEGFMAKAEAVQHFASEIYAECQQINK
jgi:hypothetical protein